jgi:uncharacterized Ntn-hydrolase superfamily protein
MTYSIVARDPTTSELGIAVQSRYFAAGRVVPWIEAGVGAIAPAAVAEAGVIPVPRAMLEPLVAGL